MRIRLTNARDDLKAQEAFLEALGAALDAGELEEAQDCLDDYLDYLEGGENDGEDNPDDDSVDNPDDEPAPAPRRQNAPKQRRRR